MRPMELVWAATLWVLWSWWLLAQHLDLPPALTRVGAGLLAAELLALAIHSFDCSADGCGPGGMVAGTAASLDVPVLAGLFVVAAVGREYRRAQLRLRASAPRPGNRS